ncbi:putative MFS family arabinose efflux permease [Actinocorallia herbida]|uniref:Putative MFS family arabinose efflux permease n=1 Tax=Actinocorallia herbida TaxID=58109 RepID=A0A3N1CYS5_9ACTN|nr:MFS transporter [Actinocorallia herbida]ROO86431.1 putative MFS family arabinose efflux permease [Actinocorallia herbida]
MGGDAGPEGEGGSLRGNRDFVLLWGGQLVSELGVRATGVALPLLVMAMTGAPALAGLAGFCGALPYVLFYLPAGVLVDRWDRKKVMLVCEAGRCLALGGIPVAVWAGRLTFPHLMVASFAAGTFFVFFSVADKSVVPALVPARQLPAAVAHLEARSRAAGLAGPPLGGLLYGMGQALPFVYDALSYAVSFTATFLIRTDLRVERAQPPAGLGHELLEGLRWLAREPFIRLSTALVGAINLTVEALKLTLVVLAVRHAGSSATAGLILGCYGAGGLAGALAAPRLTRRASPGRVAIVLTWLWAVLLLPLALVPPVPVLCGLAAAIAFGGPLWNVVMVGHQYRLIPDGLLARVKSVVLLVSWGTIPLGALAGGLLLDQAGARTTGLCLAAFMAAIAAAATLSPTIRAAAPAP